jgi:hypothetical protein
MDLRWRIFVVNGNKGLAEGWAGICARGAGSEIRSSRAIWLARWFIGNPGLDIGSSSRSHSQRLLHRRNTTLALTPPKPKPFDIA